MKFQLDSGSGAYSIRGYRPGVVVVNDEELRESFVIAPDRLLKHWEPATLAQLRPQHFSALLELEPEIVLLGTGDRIQFPDAALAAMLYERQIGFEVMDTAAACRSYMVLMAEGRRVIAALLLG